ncbi:hypothetical protein GCM10009844_27260 [Nocardioides koreensis]|uniref:Sulfotransferase family protein n=1 Tax=Nocardioides koreensis TaxID=433651 RepID=A0ABP5LJU6_9ACTN
MLPDPSSPQIASDDPAPTRRLVLVAGAGRSGTSTVAGILQRLGLVVPAPEVVSDETNPKGFSESQWVVDFHDDLLMHANVQVSDARPDAWTRTSAFAERPGATRLLTGWLEEQFSQADQVLIKDPRLSWFLPLWTTIARRVGAEPSFITMLRPPAEIVGSKRTYYNSFLQDAHGVAAWLNMLLNTERATRGSARSFVRYHDLLGDWEPTITRIGADLTLPRLEHLTPADREVVDGFVDPALRRVSLTWDDLDLPDRLATMARGAWEALDALPDVGEDAGAVTARLDEIHEQYAAYYLESEGVSRSSVIAVRQAAERARKQEPAPVPAPTGIRGFAVSAARRVPPSVRRLVPAPARARVRARLTPGGAPSGTGPGPRP